MKAICTDGTEIECENFKAIDGGVLLTKDRKRKKVIGFVPNDDLRYVVPDEAETEHRQEIEGRTGERERRGEEGDVAALRERLDRLEARLDLSATESGGRSVSTPTIEGRSPEAGAGREGEPGALDAPDAPETVAEETEAEPMPEPETGLALESANADSEEGGGAESERRAGSEERGASGTRTTDATAASTHADTDTDTNTDADIDVDTDTDVGRAETSGFDPVTVVAEQREREESSGDFERTDAEGTTDVGTVNIGRSDPVAIVAEQNAAATTGEDEPNAESAGENESTSELRRIDGLGPTYAGRLVENGIETLADLEGAGAEDVAAVADVGESRAEGWIEQAGELSSN
jgi:predicted flap endonuclease-1-like 5' DNA nuclease